MKYVNYMKTIKMSNLFIKKRNIKYDSIYKLVNLSYHTEW